MAYIFFDEIDAIYPAFRLAYAQSSRLSSASNTYAATFIIRRFTPITPMRELHASLGCQLLIIFRQ